MKGEIFKEWETNDTHQERKSPWYDHVAVKPKLSSISKNEVFEPQIKLPENHSLQNSWLL